MFDLKHHAGDNAGYQLRITYITETNQYRVDGYILWARNQYGQFESDRDGASQFFNTLQEAIDSIVNYGDKK